MAEELSSRSRNIIQLHLSGIAVTINTLVDHGYVAAEDMDAALAAYVEGNTEILDDLIASAAEDTLYGGEEIDKNLLAEDYAQAFAREEAPAAAVEDVTQEAPRKGRRVKA